MNDTVNENEPPAGDLLILAEFLYDKLPNLVKFKCGLADFAVLDVHALAEIDNTKMVINAAGDRIRQSFGPGTYFLIQIDGLTIAPEETGLTAFPLTESPEVELVGK